MGVVDEPVRRAPRHSARTGYVLYGGATGFEVAIPESVVERTIVLGKQAAPREWYGLLVGRVYLDDVGHHVVILGVVPDPEADAQRGFVRTSFGSEMRTRMAARLLYPDCIPVGWVHGHIRYGARYSSTDFKNQSTWTQPHSIGIVVDPFSEPRLGVYRGPEGEMLKPFGPQPKVPEMAEPETESKPPAAIPTPPSAAPSMRRVWPKLAAPVAVLTLLAIIALWGHVARIDERTVEIERRLTDMERARGEGATLQSTTATVNESEICQVARIDMAGDLPMCTEP